MIVMKLSHKNFSMQQTLVSLSQKEQIIVDAINDGGCATFAGITAKTEVKMRKTGNPLAGAKVTKIMDYSVTLNANYQNAVNNELTREGKEATFESAENWHEKKNDTFNGSVVINSAEPEKSYLSCIVNNSDMKGYYVNGVPATDAEIAIIKEFRNKSSVPTNQGTDKPIIFRTFKLSSILELRVKGKVLIFESLLK